MGRNILKPWRKKLEDQTTVAATVTGTAFDFPLDLDGCLFILKVSAASGTSPTLDVAIQFSPDSGTNYYDFFRFTRCTAAVEHHMVVSFRRLAEAGAIAAVTTGGNGAVNVNKPITEHCRIVSTIGGTNPSFSFVLWAFGARTPVAE
jgi:hypothetical protein